MPEIYFLLNLALAFLVGGVWVTATTVLAERFGSKVGGFIGGLPSTIVVALFFIGLNQSPATASVAANVAPVGEGVSGLFLLAYALLAKRGFYLALILALAFWLVSAAAIVILNIQDLVVSLVLYVPLFLLSYYILELRLKLRSLGKIRIKYSKPEIIGRAIFGGAVIAFAVFMSKYSGPIFGGVFSVFPAMFMSTVVLTKRSGGIEFSRAITKSLLVSGLITVVAYAVAASQLFPIFGIWLGTLGAYLISVPFAYVTYWLIQHKLR